MSHFLALSQLHMQESAIWGTVALHEGRLLFAAGEKHVAVEAAEEILDILKRDSFWIKVKE
jgi:hypothetical protein